MRYHVIGRRLFWKLGFGEPKDQDFNEEDKIEKPSLEDAENIVHGIGEFTLEDTTHTSGGKKSGRPK